MFELDSKTQEISIYFKDVIINYDLRIIIMDKHKIKLVNLYCDIEFTTGKYYCDLSITITENKTKNRFSIIEIMNKLGLTSGEKILNEKEILKSNLIQNELDNQLFCYGLVFKKYFDSILKGDFSIIH